MAKVSTKPITSINDDWGNDGTGLPYSGEAVLKFIKSELNKKVELDLVEAEVSAEVQNQLKSLLFANGARSIVTGITGNSLALAVTSINQDFVQTTDNISIGQPDTNDRFVTVATLLSSQAIKVGGKVFLNFGFRVADYLNHNIPDSSAEVELRITRAGLSNPFYTRELGTYISSSDLSVPSNPIDLTSIITLNVKGNASILITIIVKHSYNVEGEDKPRVITKYGTATLTVLALTLTTNINILDKGITSIPYTVRGNGSKTVYLYKNGVQLEAHENITSASLSGVFVIDTLPVGVTNFQLVAESIQSGETVRSSSYYFDLLGSSAGTSISLKVEDFSGDILTDYMSPTFSTAKFSDFKMEYYVYNSLQASVLTEILTEELNGDNVVSSLSSSLVLGRNLYTYSKRIKSPNPLRITFTSLETTRVINVNPLTSSINIELPTDDLKLSLDADGRNNGETNPAVWNYGDTTTKFEGFNWQSNGWFIDEGSTALILKNGAKAIINYPLFLAVNASSVTRTGCTFEILFKCLNATLEENDVITCNWLNNENNKTGLNITTTYVGVNTGESTDYKDEDGKVTQSVVTRVGSQYAQDNYYKFTFVIDPKALNNKGLCYGYLNGILSYIAPLPASFINIELTPITIDSTYADVYIKSIKYYEVPLTHDQCVDSYIIDLTSVNEIEELYKNNEVLGTDNNDNKYVSPQLLRKMGRGVMIITAQGTRLQELNKVSEKSNYYGPFRIDYYAPEKNLDLGDIITSSKGNDFNFTHTQCAIRIQGTTSTKRPRKNYRLHFNKKDKSNKPAEGSFIVGGKVKDNFKYAMSEGAVEVPIACLKVDYVDSSMTHNTGGAVIFNELTRSIDSLRNPAQLREFVDSASDIKTRVAIEGFPIDVFAADGLASPETDNGEYREILEDSRYTNLVYMGQYNFNNDKSKSGAVFGFDGSYTYDEDGTYNPDGAYQPICLEFLDNYTDLDLFKMKFTSGGNIDDAASYANFNKALEVRAPSDVTDHVAGSSLDDLATSEYIKDDEGNPTSDLNTYKWVPAQIKRLFNFIGECAKQVAQNNSKAVSSLNTMTSSELEALDWTSSKFTDEANDYFNMNSICAWYIWTDYLIAVDQRAKNMMLYTMDGKHWMLQYYDGDTILGERNDCFLAYDYLTDRNTYDNAVGQYAMQGHDSWLWYLVRANFDNTLTAICRSMRSSGKFSADYFKQILNGLFVNNWSQRQYNYSQDYKYIQPLTEDFSGTNIGTNFISTAQGSREAHRTYTLENRFNLLDAKYKSSGYIQNAFQYYGIEGVNNTLTIESSIPFYFGWILTGLDISNLQQHTLASGDDLTVTLNISGNGANNPASVLGASRIKKLTFEPGSSWTVDMSKQPNLPNIQELVASNIRANGALSLECPLLTRLDLSNSGFSELTGLQNSSKLQYIDIEGTDIKYVKFADGGNLETVKLATPTRLHLSNLLNIVYKGGDTDTLTALDWTNLSELLVNNCSLIDWEKLLVKLKESTAKIKYLRITGIDKTVPLSWLENFLGFYGLDANGNQTITSAKLVGTIHLVEYSDDTAVENYRKMYPELKIIQPEYTIIELDETIADESKFGYNSCCVTNLDNKTGARYGTKYVPSGHIANILNNTHRYLGKLVKKGSVVKIPLKKEFPDLKELSARANDGVMKVIQLDDKDSTRFNINPSRQADLSGLLENKHGEVYTKIRGFWYKGINLVYPNPAKLYLDTVSYRYTCFSTLEEKPSISPDIKVLTIEDLKKNDANYSGDGLYREKRYIRYTQEADYIIDRISTSDNLEYNIFRINVEGYKKVRYPIVSETACSVFTDAESKVITNSEGSVTNVGEIFIGSTKYSYNGMAAIATIPVGAKYFYISVSSTINYGNYHPSTIPCDIVLHKGSKFSSGEEMTDENAREWIADMEPDWVYSEPVCIACAEAASADGITLYTSFNGTKIATAGDLSNTTVPSINSIGKWIQHNMSKAAFARGLSLIDYDSAKLLAMLFTAKYGRRSSQHVLGNSSNSITNTVGVSRKYGMTDTCIPSTTTEGLQYINAAIPTYSGDTVTYTNIGSATFLGIENIHGNILEYLDRVYLVKTSSPDRNVSIANLDGTTREIFAVNAHTTTYAVSAIHGKYCDICNCSLVNGSSIHYYCDLLSFANRNSEIPSSYAHVGFLTRGGSTGATNSGVFSLLNENIMVSSFNYRGSRLQFKGNIEEVTDIDEYLNYTEIRESD